jgi:pimeloyl-ACP methyl ester carboxylesterase
MLLGLGLTAGALGISSTVLWSAFSSALAVHRARVGRGSRVMSSRFGQIEFATVGDGAPVLVSHGAGGGFDQVISAASRLIAAGYQIIAPSRFGYLRSSSPNDASPETQADAFADLLDELRIANGAIVGVSAGALSALQFAARHADRCSSLTLIVPAASVAGDAVAPQGPLPELDPMTKTIIEYTTKSDLLYWLGTTVARDRMIRSILATDPALVAAAQPDERRRALDILWNVMPISERAQGLLNDSRFVSAPQFIAFDRIKAPTLIISLEDDFYGTIKPARLVAAAIAGARLVTYATGGHVWVGHDAELFAEVDAFLKQSAGRQGAA